MSNITIEVNAQDFEKILTLDMKIALRKTFANALANLKLSVRKFTPVGVTGQAISSISSIVQGSGLGLQGEVFSHLTYIEPLELGQKPFPISAAEITPWVLYRTGSYDMVWPIVQSIRKKGTKGAFMFKKAFEDFNVSSFANNFISNLKQ